jgi:hypothetical protein
VRLAESEELRRFTFRVSQGVGQLDVAQRFEKPSRRRRLGLSESQSRDCFLSNVSQVAASVLIVEKSQIKKWSMQYLDVKSCELGLDERCWIGSDRPEPLLKARSGKGHVSAALLGNNVGANKGS